MSIVKDIPKLLQADVINQETADRIYDYYRSRHKRSPYLIVVAFSILGAILVGLGIILIIAQEYKDRQFAPKPWEEKRTRFW
jgi:uncharacterized membrane protein